MEETGPVYGGRAGPAQIRQPIVVFPTTAATSTRQSQSNGFLISRSDGSRTNRRRGSQRRILTVRSIVSTLKVKPFFLIEKKTKIKNKENESQVNRVKSIKEKQTKKL